MLNKMVYDTKPLDPDDVKEYIDRGLFDLNQKTNVAYQDLERQNQKLTSELEKLKRAVDILFAERDNNTVNNEIHEEITNLHKSKRDQHAKLDEVYDKLADLEVQIFECKEDQNRSKKNIIDNGAVNSEVIGRVEDLRKLHNDDVNQLNSKVTKKFDEISFAIQAIDKDIEEIERRRVNGENEVLKKAFQYTKDGTLDSEIMDLRRRVTLIEKEVGKPREIARNSIEDERRINEIIQGMADFEAEIKDILKVLSEHDTDIQDTAKLIHVLDQQTIKNKDMFDNINRRLESLEMLKDTVAKEKID